nr:13926_t:CDS:2 [Entrophospora candida]
MASTSSFRGQQQVSSSYGGGPPPLPPSRNQRLYGKPLPHQLPQSSYERRPSSLSHSSSTSSLYSPTSSTSNSLNVNQSPQKTLFEQHTKPIQIPWADCKIEGQRLREAEAKLTESVRKSQIDLDKVNWELEKVIHQTALATRQIELLFANSQEEIEALNKLAEKETEENQLALINNSNF